MTQTTPTRDEAVRETMTHVDWLRACAAWCPDHAHHLNDAADHLEEVEQELALLALASAPAPASGGVDAVAWRDVLAERRRQVEAEGWTAAHDDEHGNGEMAKAAAVYALCSAASSPDRAVMDEFGQYNSVPFKIRNRWPWGENWLKPKDRRSDLVRAGALILAEIERLDRASAASLSPAATPVSEAGGEAVKVLATLNRMVTDYLVPDTYKARFPKDSTLWEREFPMPDKHHSDAGAALVHQRRDAAFIRDVIHLQDNPTGVEPSEPGAHAKPASEPAGGGVREALRDLLGHVDRETCVHEETHRGGFNWTICDQCGRKWADDEGGFVPYSDPPAVARARLICDEPLSSPASSSPAEAEALPASGAEAGGEAVSAEEHRQRGIRLIGMTEHAGAHLCRAEKAEEERDALLSALGFKPGSFKDELTRKVILDDAEGLRPAMVEARREASRVQGDADLWTMRMLDEWPGDTLLLRLWRQKKEAERERDAALAKPASSPAVGDAAKVLASMAGGKPEDYAGMIKPDIFPSADEAARVLRDRDACRSNLGDAWAAMRMIREAVETLGPIGAMPAEEHLAGPTFLHEAEAIVAGIMKMKEAPGGKD